MPPPPGVGGAGRGSGTVGRGFGSERDAAGDRPEDLSSYDHFSGYGGALFRDAPYEADDAEADRVYAAVDEAMDGRRKRQREERQLQELKRFRTEHVKIGDQFADLKAQLGSSMSEADWEAIPEAADQSLRRNHARKQAEVFTPMTDKLIVGAAQQGATANTLQDGAGGAASVAPGGGGGGLAGARGTMLGLKLDKMSDSVSGQTVVDPQGYLTGLNSAKITSDAEIGDIKKARLLLHSVISTNPRHGPGWIAAARLEEVAGQLVQARKLMRQGAAACPESEDVWLEGARLQTPANAKSVLAEAVRHLPRSVKIWAQAAALEQSAAAKRRVLRRALEFVPNSVALWQAAVELEDDESNARLMLSRAVECVPHATAMWLALAHLQPYAEARAVLNRARAAVPTDAAIWLEAAMLEEARGRAAGAAGAAGAEGAEGAEQGVASSAAALVDKIVAKALASLGEHQVVIPREKWLADAEACEARGAPLTAGAVARHCAGLGVDPEDRKRTWLDDAETSLGRGAVQTARALFAHTLTHFPHKKGVWLAAADLERKHGGGAPLEALLKRAVSHCPQAEVLWLMAAKEAWLGSAVPRARAILTEAFAANPNSEAVWLAAVKLEWENEQLPRARQLLAKARERAPTRRVHMKSAILEREAGDAAAEEALLAGGLALFPADEKLHLMRGQAAERRAAAGGAAGAEHVAAARKAYAAGLRQCPGCVPLWQHAAALEERHAGVTKARSVLELARLKNRRSAALWVSAVRLEQRAGNAKLADTMMAKALQECPADGVVWAEAIRAAAKPQRRSRSVDALKKCEDDAGVVVAVARLFVSERKLNKARKWLHRATALDPALGDAWVAYFRFETEHGTAEQAAAVAEGCARAEPTRGEIWCQVAKRIANRRCAADEQLRRVAAAVDAEGEERLLA
jgi:pre-mRNA-processing factor 6